MILKRMITALFLLHITCASAKQGSQPEAAADDMINSAVLVDAGVQAVAANDYLCGSVAVQVADGWKIKMVEMKSGSIQNQFQFNKKDKLHEFYEPDGLGDNFVHVRQSTGISNYSRLYPLSYSIDFVLTLTKDDDVNEVSYRVQKSVCNSVQVGEVKLTHLRGDTQDYIIKNSEQDDTTWKIHWLSARYFTPAYVLIPAPVKDNPDE